MRHAAFAALIALYVVTFGQNWTWYAAALMAGAWVTHHRRTL